jgi:hypothetical protein
MKCLHECFRRMRLESQIFCAYNADMISQGQEIELTASKASESYEEWHLSSKDARPSVRMPPTNLLPLPSLPPADLKLRLLELLANDLL